MRRSRLHADDGAFVRRIEAEDRAYQAALDRVIVLRKEGAALDRVAYAFETEIQPARERVVDALRDLSSLEERQLRDATKQSKQTVSGTLGILLAMTALGVAASAVLWWRLSRMLRTERARQEELALHVARVEQLNRELDAFAGRVSHDLRNLISPIHISVSVLRRSTNQPAKVEELTSRIQRCLDRAVAMIEGLLAFSRSSAPAPGATSAVHDAVNDALEQLGTVAARVDATIERDLAPLEVSCSRELLDVLLLNLIGNALKFMEGCERRHLRVATRAHGESCELTIADTGPGIPREAMGRIFEPFYRAPSTRAPGLGIGLATVARIVEAHGGSIAVESTPGCGTTFRVSLPLAPRLEAVARERVAPVTQCAP